MQRHAFESHYSPKILHHIPECTSTWSAPVEEWACDPGTIFGGRNHKKAHHRTSRAFLITIIAQPAKQACSQDMQKQAHHNLQYLRLLLRILQSEPKHDTEKNTITTNSVDVCKISYQHQHQHNDKVSRPVLLTFCVLGPWMKSESRCGDDGF